MGFLQRINGRIKYEVLKYFKPEIIGYTHHPNGHPLTDTRISNVTHVSYWENVDMGNNVFIGHFSYIDGYDKVKIGDGCQITNYVSILTHSSHNSIRIYGEYYIQEWKRKGMKAGLSAPVHIGEYSFIGPHSVIMPGSVLGKGCIVSAFSFVRGTFPDYSIIKGNPAEIVGDTREIDEDLLLAHPELREFYYLSAIKSKKQKVILFTLYYPYTYQGVSYDLYVKSEVDKLAANFDSVEIISLSKGHDGQLETPSNVTVHNLSSHVSFWDKCKLIKIIWKDYFIQELRGLKYLYNRKINMSLLKSISIYAIKAEKQTTFLGTLLDKINFEETDVRVYSYWNLEEALAAILLSEKYPIKTLIRTHSLDLYFDRVPEKYLPFRRYTYFKSDLFTFISEQGMNYFFDTHKITPNLFSKAFVNRIGIKNDCLVKKRDFSKLVILSNAWIRPLKRIDLLIESLALINNFSLEWIHVGDDYGTNTFSYIKNLATEKLGNRQNIKFQFIGRKNMTELYDILNDWNINLLINVSSTEGTPVSMMEALSFGIPIIATAVGGVPEIVEDNTNGFLLPANVTAKEVAEKIIFYHNLSEDKKQELSKNARQKWEEKFRSEKNTDEMLNRLMSV